ncbi:MAG: hypothetical protein J6V07_02265, partial [Clostridia bacterium]|nr:hypothetical protein [Clostridia bacterium]
MEKKRKGERTMLHEGLPPEERYYYRHLNENARRLYLEMLRGFLRLELSYSYRQTVELMDSGDAFEAIRWDYPELFWIQRSIGVGQTDENFDEYYRVAEDGTVTATLGIYYTKEEILEILTRLDSVYHEFDGITDPFELELAAYRYAIEHFEYAHEHRALSGKDQDEVHTLAGLMRNGRGVCSAYTRFIQYILGRRGIPAVAILQAIQKGNDESGHAWLAVMIDGEYYHLDATFDDGDEDNPRRFPYRHFNITDEEIANDRDLDPTLYPDIVCRATAANYYRRRGLYFETDDEALRGARRFLREREPTEKGALYFFFRMPP